MNYQRIYHKLILKAKERDNLEVYSELHHILPRCLGGLDTEQNLVRLTAKEHFLAHLLLVEIYPKSYKLKYALWMMTSMETKQQKRYRVSGRTYQRIKESISTKSEKHKNKISKGLKRSYREGRRKSNAGRKMPKSFGESISKAKKGMKGTNTGKRMSKEQKVKISKKLKGHEVSKETRLKISNSLKKRNKNKNEKKIN